MKIEEGEGFILEWLYQVPERDCFSGIVVIHGGKTDNAYWLDGNRVVPVDIPLKHSGYTDHPLGVVSVATAILEDVATNSASLQDSVMLGVAVMKSARPGEQPKSGRIPYLTYEAGNISDLARLSTP